MLVRLLGRVDAARASAALPHETHEIASRYCFIDYDREMAIVAELQEEPDGRR